MSAKLNGVEVFGPEQVYSADETALFWKCTPKCVVPETDRSQSCMASMRELAVAHFVNAEERYFDAFPLTVL